MPQCANPLCFLKWFLCFDGPYTVFILIYPHWFLLYPFLKVCWLRVVLFSHAALTHTHRFRTLSWTRWNNWKVKICKMSPLTVENWWKKQDEKEKMSCAVTYNGEGMVEAGIGSKKFLRMRILEILKETPFFGHHRSVLIASRIRTSPIVKLYVAMETQTLFDRPPKSQHYPLLGLFWQHDCTQSRFSWRFIPKTFVHPTISTLFSQPEVGRRTIVTDLFLGRE